MARNRRRMPVSRQSLWATLSDGKAYARWVVGTSSIREVDDHWPAQGSRLHYSVGRGPLRHDGHTEVVSVDPGRRLEREAHAWPVGAARIEISLTDDGPGTVVDIDEHPSRGAGALLHNPVTDLLLKLRNVEALRRLERHAQR
ncbi:MAG TPA: SRPBCC domain-containing protein [Mycobacteriales bacterium]|nr:SRPBCC domain-containing protein [Mycobacteriales bacterium]